MASREGYTPGKQTLKQPRVGGGVENRSRQYGIGLGRNALLAGTKKKSVQVSSTQLPLAEAEWPEKPA